MRRSLLGINVDAKDLKETVKGFPIQKVDLTVLIITALLLFLPDAVLTKIYLLDFKNKFGTYIGLAFVISACVLIVMGGSQFIFNMRCKKEFFGKRARKKISNLTKDEKSILLYMRNNQNKTIFLPCTNGAVLNLKNQFMISYASNTGTMVVAVQLMPYMLQPWVIKAINDNDDLFEGVTDRLPEDISKFSDMVSL